LRSRLFWELGGFDDSFFAHMEEIDLCWRYKRAGYLILDGIAGLAFLAKMEFAAIPAILKAHLHFYKMLLSGKLSKRKAMEDERIRRLSIAPQPNEKGLYKKSILVRYFIKGKKHFSELDDT